MADQVESLIREVAAEIILPRFRHLSADEISMKTPGDAVTIADQESERALTAGLTALVPGSSVLGEEAVAADPAVMSRVHDPGDLWIVDPVDGTNNFAAGKTPFAVMVARLRDGVPVGAWIYDVPTDSMTTAEAGAGAYRDGVRLKTRTDDPGPAGLSGMVGGRHMTEDLFDRVRGNASKFAKVTPGRHCAGWEYPAVAADDQQFASFWRILPWDHVAGSLIVREAGGVVRHLDGSDYHPTDAKFGLLIAPNPDVWQTVRTELFD